MKTVNPKISVIVPVYGVEKFIGRCAHSLMEQTMTDGVEFLFIDDATTDKSIEVLREVLSDYPALENQVRVITHEFNKGLPSARNTGLAAATGEYVVHVDADDFAEPQMLELLYKAAVENDADFVWCDYYITFSDTGKRRVIAQPAYDTPLDAVKGMLRGTMKYNVWNKMCRCSLYVDGGITFPDGNPMGEDLTMVMVALHARRCAVVKKPLYNYLQNPGQMSATYEQGALRSLMSNCNRLWDYIRQNFSHLGLEPEHAALCQSVKWPFLLDGKRSSYRTWHEWFPESDSRIWQTEGVSTRRKFIEWCAARHLYPVVWLHYMIVIKLYYGIVYGK